MAKQDMKQRRAIIAGLGAVAAAGALGARSAEAQASSSDSFTPMLHPQDDWMSAIKGSKHRIVLDVTSPAGVPDAIRFAGNLLAGHKNGWGVEESDVALLVCVRHGATPSAIPTPSGRSTARRSTRRRHHLPRRTPTTLANRRSSRRSPSAACSSWCAGRRVVGWQAALPDQAETWRPSLRKWAPT